MMRIRATAATLVVFLIGWMLADPAWSQESGLVELRAVGLEFEGPDEAPSGWTTIRLINDSQMEHFAVFARYPEGRGVDDHQNLVAPNFQEGMDLLNEGLVDSAMAAFGRLPDWYGEVVFFGGPGLVSPGRTTQVTVDLQPGTYVVECYVKTGGIFHSYNPVEGEYGMVHEITVLDEANGRPAPDADIEMTISSTDGTSVDDEVTAGRHTVAVQFADQAPHENFVGHDVHLVRLYPDQDMSELTTWMDWTQAAGLETPAPAEFIGGTNEMPAGTTANVTVDLEPGRYAWIAEVPNAAEKGMLRTFEVAE